jgi:predicted Ser/Thr protein kinase
VSNDLAGYEFIQAVGKGAMGSVYLARQTALNRYVAIKQVLGAWNGDPQALERFRREARALAKMNHPNVVGIYNLEAVGSDLYMIQEYVHGPTLKQIQSKERLGHGQSLRVISEVAAALEYASKQGILHRDLKPGNLFITTTGVCKLGDFGLVKMMGGAGNFQTQVGTILGTPSYMSPEQAAGKAEIDQRTDVYSLGVMSYELLVGRLPFPPVPGNVMATVEAHISEAPPKPSQLVPGFPSKVEDALLQALAKDPKKRPKSASEFWVRLADAGQKAWPKWSAESDLAAAAAALAPPAPALVRHEPGDATMGAAAAVNAAVAGGPPPAPPAPPPSQFTISPVETTALMAGSEATLVRPPTATDDTVALADETVVRPMSDETVVQPMSDETMVRPGSDETVVVGGAETVALPAPPPPPSMHPGQPAGAPAFIPPPPAPAVAALPSPAAFTVPQVQAPVYQPPVARKKRRPTRLLLPLVLLLLLAAGAFVLYTRLSGAPVAVTAASAKITTGTSAEGHCPSANFSFTGTIQTNGESGEITYQWVQPDGTLAAPAVQPMSKGQTSADVSLQFTYKGNGDATGDKTQLKVLKPSAVDSNVVPVQYRCP